MSLNTRERLWTFHDLSEHQISERVQVSSKMENRSSLLENNIERKTKLFGLTKFGSLKFSLFYDAVPFSLILIYIAKNYWVFNASFKSKNVEKILYSNK